MNRLLPVVVLFGVCALSAQDRLRTMPGFDQYQRMAPLLAGAWVSGAIAPRWEADSRGFTYAHGGRTFRFDVATLAAAEVPQEAASPATQAGRGGAGRGQATPPVPGQAMLAAPGRGGAEQAQNEMPQAPMAGCPAGPIARGRQAFCVLSPDGTRKAFYRSRNLWIANVDGSGEVRVTNDGSERARIKNGVASWVYGEELSQTTAIWWSPDSRKVGFYRFDESQIQDFFIAMNQTGLQTTLDVEAYPKAGTPNPIADVFVYDLHAAKATRLDVRDGRAFDNGVGHYVYNIRWRPDSRELLLNRANRRQQIVELAACAVDTGRCRTIVREEWPTGWIDTDSAPTPRFLSDNTRFIWESSRNGWVNYYLYDVTGRLIAPLTANQFDAAAIVKIDERAGLLYYTARHGDNFLKTQLHRVGLDGRGDVRLTDPAFLHGVGNCGPPAGGGRGGAAGAASCGISPDNKYIVDVYQRHDQPPATQLLDAAGRVVAQIAQSDTSRLQQLSLRPAEHFTYPSADGSTTLYGQITFPSNFDPSRKYPVLVPVYGGPVSSSNLAVETFVPPNPNAEYGFLIVNLTYRGVPGTGRRGADALYLKLGQTEMDDMAEGIKALHQRPYVDRDRVGIYGTSYGGYTAAMQLVRHPELFAAASSSSPVTDWRNYDTIYTERYMWVPEENKAGYDAGAVMSYAANLRGRLLLYYGTADNNVHPSNSLQLVRALQRANKSFELQVGPDLPHSGVNAQRMMEFFIENLIVRPERLIAR